MAEHDFFDRLNERAADFRASEIHRADDWAALQSQLDIALPQPKKERRALLLPIVLPAFLLAGLMSSNAIWWQTSRDDRAAISRLETQLFELKNDFQTAAKAPPATSLTVRIDTVFQTKWRTVYVSENSGNNQFNHDFIQKTIVLNEKEVESAASPVLKIEETSPSESVKKASDLTEQKFGLANFSGLKTNEIRPLEWTRQPAFFHQIPLADVPKTAPPIRPFRENTLDFLRPKFFKIGASLGMLSANSPGLMHKGGLGCSLGGEIGFSKKWSLSADFGAGRMHYKAHSAAAILGNPALPIPPYSGQHLATADVTGQQIRQISLGLRHHFSKSERLRPFVGLGFGWAVVLPFAVEYEIWHEPTATFEKGIFEVTDRTRLPGFGRIEAGLNVPFSRRLELSLGSFYQRQWKKTSRQTPDLAGIRLGLNRLF